MLGSIINLATYRVLLGADIEYNNSVRMAKCCMRIRDRTITNLALTETLLGSV